MQIDLQSRFVSALLYEGRIHLSHTEPAITFLESEVLLSSVLHKTRAELFKDPNIEIPEEQAGKYFDLIRRRAKGEPIAYLIRKKEFYSLSFYVNPNVLIPRPETELLIDSVLSLFQNQMAPSPMRVLDVGTGSGAIAVTIKKNLPEAQVWACDISDRALQVARLNAEKHGTQIGFLQTDLLQGLTSQFDVIVANLPYCTSEEISKLPQDVRDYEPHLALHGGQDGLEKINLLISQAPQVLESPGWLILEVGCNQSKDVVTRMSTFGFSIYKILNDLAGIPRVVIGRKL